MKLKYFLLLISLFILHITIAQDVSINKGSGNFLINGSAIHQNDTISIFYHMPQNFTPNSQILLVIPGAGRNADDYRDSWVEASEKSMSKLIRQVNPKKQQCNIQIAICGWEPARHR